MPTPPPRWERAAFEDLIRGITARLDQAGKWNVAGLSAADADLLSAARGFLLDLDNRLTMARAGLRALDF